MRVFFKSLICLPLLVAGMLSPAASASPLELNEQFDVNIAGQIRGNVAYYNDRWDFGSESKDCVWSRETTADGLTGNGVWTLDAGQQAKLALQVLNVNENKKALRYTFDSATTDGIGTNSLSFQLLLPAPDFTNHVLQLDDTQVILPQEMVAGAMIGMYEKIHFLSIPLATGTLEIVVEPNTTISLLDFRCFSQQDFALRLDFSPSAGKITHSTIEFTLTFRPHQMDCIDLKSAANSTFDDQTADDGICGWSDQGSENDMRCFDQSEIRSGALQFQCRLPGDAEKQCIVLGGGGRRKLPRNAELSLENHNQSYRTLFLLHSLAWPAPGEIGTILARYTDGSTSLHKVAYTQDVGNWWLPTPYSNAIPVWSGFNGQSIVGLYASAFTLEGKPLESLEFTSNGRSVWMIAGVTLSTDAARLPSMPTEDFVTKESESWGKISRPGEIEADSALDFSFLLDAPAGKHGAVVRQGDHFSFAGAAEQTIRFYGANLCMGANFPTHETATRLAERLSRTGYNAVRFHQFDMLLAENGLASFDAEKLDRLQFLFAELKKRGIYVTIDLYTLRNADRAALGTLPPLTGMTDHKVAAMLFPAATRELQQFTASYLNAVNPYTKLTMAQDPALFGICLINESTLPFNVRMISPALRDAVEADFQSWLAQQALELTQENRTGHFATYLAERYQSYFESMTNFLRNELASSALITDQNYIVSPNSCADREQYGYADLHQYWDHPSFPETEWQFPVQNSQQSVLAGRLSAPSALGPGRVLGMPFTVTEFDFCYPNRFRAEGAVLFGAYAGLQDWSGLFRFDYAGREALLEEDATIEIFDVVNDPVRLLSERIGMAFFLRGDVRKAERVFPILAPRDPEHYSNTYPASINDLTLIARTGSFSPEQLAQYQNHPALLHVGNPAPENALDGASSDLYPQLQSKNLLSDTERSSDGNKIQSETGELKADFAKRTFRAVTPRSEALILPEQQQMQGDFLAVNNLKTRGVFAAIALDDASLKTSSRILILHLTNVMQAEERFRNQALHLWVSKSHVQQLLAEEGKAEITLALPSEQRRNWKLYRLNLAGQRVEELPLEVQGNVLGFEAHVLRDPQSATLAYELVQE